MNNSVTGLSIEIVRSKVVGCSVGRDLRYLSVVDSTNRVLADLPPGEWSSGTVLLADFQQAGRGRSGRSWHAPAGTSVILSVIFQREPTIVAPDYTMMFALAVRDALETASGLDVRLKWPNDLMLDRKKVAGMLGESSRQRGIDRVILGVGINVNFGRHSTDTLPEGATALDIASGRELAREDVAVALIRSVDLWYRSLTHRADDVFGAWASALETVGLEVSIHESGTTWNGTALGVQRDGGLLVETSDGRARCVYAADVSLRHPGAFTGH
jgi:BirA family transcriptional regulator, biotin operon repressor / biotin---[acetyl-CoA-carboxylase] ligase